MIENLRITRENENNFLLYTPEANHAYSKFSLLWLDSWRNDYFFNWTIHEVALKQSLYTNLAEYKSLKECMHSLKKDDIFLIMREICRVLGIVNNSVLDVENIGLDLDNIFLIKDKKSIEIKFIYLPLKNNLRSKDEFNEDFKILMTTFVKRLIEMDEKEKYKTQYQKLLSTIPRGFEALSFELSSTIDNKQTKTIVGNTNTRSSNSFYKQVHDKFDVIIKSLNLPTILIGIAFICMILIYIIEYSQNGIHLSVLFPLLAIIALAAITVIFLSLAPGSPYRIEFSSSSLDKNEYEFPEEDDTYSDKMALHPYKLNRTMRIDLIEGYIQNLPNIRTWNILTSEFTIGSHSYADLKIDSGDSNELFLRIVQRAGSFFIAAISKDVDCYLESRLMNRFDEYELSNTTNIKLLNLHFRLTIQ